MATSKPQPQTSQQQAQPQHVHAQPGSLPKTAASPERKTNWQVFNDFASI